MLSPRELSQAFAGIGPDLRLAVSQRQGEVAAARTALGQLSALSRSETDAMLCEVPYPGARLTEEQGRYPSQRLPFIHRFAGHRPAREWAATVLEGSTTLAVDGSQLSLADDIDPPVAAAQVGWFVNPHQPSLPHQKDVRMEIIIERPGSDSDPADRVDVRRFEMEVERLLELMGALAERQPAPVCFLDDPLVLPFAAERGTGRPEAYVRGMSALLEESERLRVPIVGYTADPSARDLGRMLRSLGLLAQPAQTPDSLLLAPVLSHWGDRSCLYICARPSPHLAEYRRADGSSLADQIAFCYLRVTGHGRPARLELPRWVAEDLAECDRVLDLVRAECVAGLGYPYVLEAAHDAAVISAGDRARFARAFTAFCAESGVPAAPTAKASNKRRRRGG